MRALRDGVQIHIQSCLFNVLNSFAQLDSLDAWIPDDNPPLLGTVFLGFSLMILGPRIRTRVAEGTRLPKQVGRGLRVTLLVRSHIKAQAASPPASSKTPPGLAHVRRGCVK
jgi:hypothetical protein